MYAKICIVFDNSFSLSEYICFTALCSFWTSLTPSSVSGTQMCPFTDTSVWLALQPQPLFSLVTATRHHPWPWQQFQFCSAPES